MSTLKLTIDGQEVEARSGESLLDVARRAGAEIPSLCHHPHLKPYGACRLCLVEVTHRGRTKLTTSCNYEVQDGIAVATATDRVLRHRRMVLRLLLAMAPDAARVKGLARAAGVTESGFLPHEPPAGRERCILCGLCARVCEDVVGAAAIGFAGRGEHKGLVAPFRQEVADSCVACGACAFVCPTEAIDMESRRVALLKRRPATERPCRYALLGLAPGALCANEYECARCEIDQNHLERTRPEHPVFAGRGLVPVKE